MPSYIVEWIYPSENVRHLCQPKTQRIEAVSAADARHWVQHNLGPRAEITAVYRERTSDEDLRSFED